MLQKNKVENEYGRYLSATLTVHTPKDTHPKYFNQEVISLWYYIKETETLHLRKQVVLSNPMGLSPALFLSLAFPPLAMLTFTALGFTCYISDHMEIA